MLPRYPTTHGPTPTKGTGVGPAYALHFAPRWVPRTRSFPEHADRAAIGDQSARGVEKPQVSRTVDRSEPVARGIPCDRLDAEPVVGDDPARKLTCSASASGVSERRAVDKLRMPSDREDSGKPGAGDPLARFEEGGRLPDIRALPYSTPERRSRTPLSGVRLANSSHPKWGFEDGYIGHFQAAGLLHPLSIKDGDILCQTRRSRRASGEYHPLQTYRLSHGGPSYFNCVHKDSSLLCPLARFR